MSDANIFATLRGGGRVWAVAAIHGEAERLRRLHDELEHDMRPGDRLVYLGDYLGYGPQVRETVDELLVFRRKLMARGMDPEDIVFLRGAQEEMWQKMLQLQFAPNPADVLNWMMDHGIGSTLAAYGGSVTEGINCARDGTLALTKWTGQLRANMRAFDGHTTLMSVLRHAAFTDDECMLFVHAGIDPTRPLSAQMDAFWWGSAAFLTMDGPYGSYRLVVRGSDRRRGGVRISDHVATLDGGCGFGGSLTAACFDGSGVIVKMIEA